VFATPRAALPDPQDLNSLVNCVHARVVGVGAATDHAIVTADRAAQAGEPPPSSLSNLCNHLYHLYAVITYAIIYMQLARPPSISSSLAAQAGKEAPPPSIDTVNE
jgi:hypothetical protein